MFVFPGRKEGRKERRGIPHDIDDRLVFSDSTDYGNWKNKVLIPVFDHREEKYWEKLYFFPQKILSASSE